MCPWLERRATDRLLEHHPLFTQDTDGMPPKRSSSYHGAQTKLVHARFEEITGGLSFDIRVEGQNGISETVGYVPSLACAGWFLWL